MEKYCVRTLDNKVHTLLGNNALIELIRTYMGSEVSKEVSIWANLEQEVYVLEADAEKYESEIEDLKEKIKQLEKEKEDTK